MNRRTGDWRGASLALALIALLVNILVPAGYMTVSGAQGPALVICSGHGPVSVAPDDLAKPLKAPKSKPDAPCAFAGHGLATPPPLAIALAGQTLAVISSPARVLADLVPGRGLAAPPPPSQAPPTDL